MRNNTMKKIYINPTTRCVDIESEQLIADSLNTNLGDNGPGGNTGDNGITEGDAKRQSLWDNEW